MKAIMLVAGYATRLKKLTENKPKGLLLLNNKPIINYTFEKLEKIGVIDEAILVSNSKFYEQFLEWAREYKGKIKISVLNDETTSNDNRLGAIGDLCFAIEKLKVNDEIMVFVSDNYFTYELKDFYDFYINKKANCILGCEFADLEYLGTGFAVVCVDEENKVIDLIEKPLKDSNLTVKDLRSNLGAYATYIYTKDTCNLIKEYLKEGNNKDAPGNLPAWLCKRNDTPVYFYTFKGECYDIGTPEVYYNLDKKLKQN